jgi:hypothetical protein
MLISGRSVTIGRTRKPRIKGALLVGRFRFGPLQRVTKADGSEADLWSARDVLVLKGWRSCWRGSCRSRRAASSFIEVVLAIFVRGSDSNAAARQCLPKKYLDFGIDTP